MELFFRTVGKENGKPLVILHGLYGCSDNWASIAKELGDSYHVFLPDLRNHGNSFHSTVHDYDSMTKDVYDLIHARVCEKIVLLGHSMGGKVAMNFASLYPDMVQKIIVVDIAPKSYLDTQKFGSQIKMHKTIINTIQRTDLKKYSSRDEIEGEFIRFIDSEKIRKLLHKNIKRDKNSFSWKLNIGSVASNFNHILDQIEPVMNKPVTIPALFLRGEYSDYISDQDITLISRIFPDHKIETIPGSGHWVHVEQPAKLIERVKDFLDIRDE